MLPSALALADTDLLLFQPAPEVVVDVTRNANHRAQPMRRVEFIAVLADLVASRDRTRDWRLMPR